MALQIADNFSYKGGKPLDSRLVSTTLASLLSIPSYDIYDGIMVYVESEDKYYVYDSANTVDANLDKWREFTSGSGGNLDILRYSKIFTAEVNNQEDIALADISSADIQVNQLINDTAGIIGKVVSVNATNNLVKVQILSKDTIVKNEVVEYDGELEPEINKMQTINFSDIITIETITNFGLNHLIYDANGTLAKILAKDTTAGTLTVIPVSIDVAIMTNDVYLYSKPLNKDVNSVALISFADISTSKLIEDVDVNQLVYDNNGTLAKIVAVDLNNSTLSVCTITNASDTTVEVYLYQGTNLTKIPNNNSILMFSDLDTSKAINDIKVGELVHDSDGTIAKITMVDIPNGEILVKTLSVSGMGVAPVLKELVLKNGGSGYTVGDIIQSSTAGIFAEVLSVDSHGMITSIGTTTSTIVSTAGIGAVVDYDTVLYGAFGRNWAPISNSSAHVAYIVGENFTYDQGMKATITAAGTGYAVGDIVNVGGGYFRVVTVDTGGKVTKLSYSRSTTISTSGSGLAATVSISNDIFIIPSNVWSNAQRNTFELTNDDGASVSFNRLDGVTERCSAGKDSIYRFTFDSLNGAIYQEKTEISGGIGPFVPFKNYKKDDIIISNNVIYISKDNHVAAASLGADIVHWEEMRKQMTSGMRYVKVKLALDSTISSGTWTVLGGNYVEGDGSMYDANDKGYRAPVDGLYILNLNPISFNGASSSSANGITYNTTSAINWLTNNQRTGNCTTGATVIKYLKAGDKLYNQLHINRTLASTDIAVDCYIEFTLLTDDRSDNLIAEATLSVPTTIAVGSYNMIFKDSSNISVLNGNKIILPEDGSYIVSTDLVLVNNGVSGILETAIKDSSGNTIIWNNARGTAVSALSLCGIISGSKGTQFNMVSYKDVAQSNITVKITPKIRLFKIKSVDSHIDSHDLYKDSGSLLSYDDWIANKMRSEQLTVTTKINSMQPIGDTPTVIQSTYQSGEASMYSNGKFIAPISGLYAIVTNNIRTADLSCAKSLGIKKNNISNNYVDILATNLFTSRINSTTYIGWLNKNDYLTVVLYSASATTISNPATDYPDENKITFVLLNAGITSSYDVNKPHLWPVNTEVNLGDGLYGYRTSGTITVNKDIQHEVILRQDTEPFYPISNGGYWCFRNDNMSDVYAVGQYILDGTVKRYSAINNHKQGANQLLVFLTLTSNDRTDAPYDVWCTYKKGV